jgi:hypothetical protein
MAKNTTMRRFLLAAALCAVLVPALAEVPALGRPARPAPAADVVQTALVTPAAAAQPVPRAVAGDTTVVIAGFDGDPAMVPAATPSPAQAEDDRPPNTTAMLLTALVLMSGIALRRWGSDQP